MHNIELILTITGGLAFALVFGYVTQRLGLSPIVGYLLAGVAVGPHTPGFQADANMAPQLAEVGVILLLFGVGLQFHVKELLAVRRIAIPGAVVQSLAATGLGMLVAVAFGFGWKAGLVFGLALSVASTVVLIRVLSDNNDLHTPSGHIAVGWLVVEDLFTVLVLVMLPAIFPVGEAAGGAGLILTIALALLKILALVVFTFLVGDRVIPWLLTCVAATRSRELFTLTVLVVALGIAVGSAELFGASMALGAFLAGLVVGRSDFSLRAATEALPMRDAFAVLFFVSVGMLFDPLFLLQEPWLVAATLAVVLIGKPLAALGITLLLGYPAKIALAVAIALAQVGEFSFILAALGTQLQLFPPNPLTGTHPLVAALVAAAILSITLNPLAYRTIDALERWAARRPRLAGWLRGRRKGEPAAGKARAEDATADRHRAVVIGYGPVGQTVTRLLQESEVEPTVIELNLETVQRLRAEGVAVVYGDAAHRETLQSAGVASAGTLILSSAGMRVSQETIRIARELNPRIRVLARANYLRERAALRAAGADRVFTAEGEVALAMAEHILRGLGASPEQIDRERDRVREDLFGATKDATLTAVMPVLLADGDPAPAAEEPQPSPPSADGEPAPPKS